MMPTSLQILILSGLLVGAGVALLATRLVPAQPDLAHALDRLAPASLARGPLEADPTPTDLPGRIGLRAMRLLPAGVWGPASTPKYPWLMVSSCRTKIPV